MSRPHSLFWLVPALMLLAAPLPFPYGYYQALRLVVFGCAVLLAWYEVRRQNGQLGLFSACLIGTAVLFNPALPIFLSKAIWMPIDVACGALFLTHWRQQRVPA